jgi:hypothetical protein
MTRFFFHLVADKLRYEDDTGTVLASLEDVLLHGASIAKILTKYHLMQINIGREPNPDDYLEVEDQDSNFVITLPFASLLKEAAEDASTRNQPIDLADHRIARHLRASA